MFAFMEKKCHVRSYKQLAKVNISPLPQWFYRDKHLLKRFQRCQTAVGRELSIIKRRAKSLALAQPESMQRFLLYANFATN